MIAKFRKIGLSLSNHLRIIVSSIFILLLIFPFSPIFFLNFLQIHTLDNRIIQYCDSTQEENILTHIDNLDFLSLTDIEIYSDHYPKFISNSTIDYYQDEIASYSSIHNFPTRIRFVCNRTIEQVSNLEFNSSTLEYFWTQLSTYASPQNVFLWTGGDRISMDDNNNTLDHFIDGEITYNMSKVITWVYLGSITYSRSNFLFGGIYFFQYQVIFLDANLDIISLSIA